MQRVGLDIPGQQAAPNFLDMGPGFAVVDIETTGLSVNGDRIVEIAIVQADSQVLHLQEWSTRVNPEGTVGSTHIHGITQADVANSPTFAQIAPTVAAFLHGRDLVAHNAKFDLGFIHNEFHRAGWEVPLVPFLCTLSSAREYLPQEPFTP